MKSEQALKLENNLIMKKLLLLIIISSFSFLLIAQEKSPIIFIYDASGSMWGQLEGKTKKEIATTVLSTSVNNLSEKQQIGLVAYGHRQKGDCQDVEFLIDPNNQDKSKVIQSLKGINPLGKTPLAYAAKQVIGQLRVNQMKATIILITDGIESCNGDICTVVKAAKEEGIDFKLHIVGFGIKDNDTRQLKCAAKAGDGQYYDANNTDGLSEVLNEATKTTVDDPNPNFSIFATKNGQPIDAIAKVQDTKKKTYNINIRTYADTGFVYLVPGNYTLEVKPVRGK